MRRKFLHMLLGAIVLGSYSSVMAAETGTINMNAKAYTAPTDEAEISLHVYEGEEVKVNQEIDGYYEIVVDDEVVYIKKDYLIVEGSEEITEEDNSSVAQEAPQKQVAVVTPAPVAPKAPASPVATKTSKGEAVVAYAKQFIGTPYVSGGNSLSSGVDCSGFTKQVFKNFGVNLERSSRSQYASNGTKVVSKSELQPGDLVFYGYSSVSHVAIYVGDSKIIHAPVPGKSVCIAPLSQRGDAPIIGYKRVI